MDLILDLRARDRALLLKVTMDLREGNHFIASGQAYGPNLVFEDVGQGADPMNAMDPKEGLDQHHVLHPQTQDLVHMLGRML
jgi:hypothetical protein